MSAQELFEQEVKPARLSFDVWLGSLAEADRSVFVKRATDTSISHAAFVRVAKALGGSFAKETVTSWRREHGFSG